jgi:hypothetical protein
MVIKTTSLRAMATVIWFLRGKNHVLYNHFMIIGNQHA